MPWSPPSFPLVCNIWRHDLDPTTDPPSLAAIRCNLALGRRVTSGPDKAVDVGIDGLFRFVLCPRGTDIRGQFAASGTDWVEVPAGSGRYYYCLDSEITAQGFANEYVTALCVPLSGLPPISSSSRSADGPVEAE